MSAEWPADAVERRSLKSLVPYTRNARTHSDAQVAQLAASAGQAIYDPFVGSGTTMIAAEMEARSSLCLEIDPGYCDVAVERWQAFTGEAATLESDGRTFAAHQAERKAA